MKRKKKSYAAFEIFSSEIESKYGVTRDEVIQAIDRLGAVKTKIRTYFLVEHYLKKKSNVLAASA